jgi:signal transduction histidine kinase
MSTTQTAISVQAPAAPAGSLSRMLRESLYLVTGLPVAAASFTLLMCGLSTSVSAVILVGLPAAIVTLLVGRGFAKLERVRVRALGYDLPPAIYRPLGGQFRTWLGVLRDSQSWLAVLHGIVVMPLAIITFTIAVFWWFGALVGLSYWWLKLSFQPIGNTAFRVFGPNAGFAEAIIFAGIGLALLMSLIPVIHRLALMHVAVDRLLLGNDQVRRLQGRVDALTASRAAAVEAEAHALQRLERDLHDGPQQRLVRLGMDLSAMERRLEDDDAESARLLLAEARTQTADALAELRALSRGIAPPILLDRGLAAALAAVAARCTVQVDLHVGLPEGSRLPASVERAAYFMVSEALANVAKHSRANRVQIRVLRDRTYLRLEVEDNGVGGAHPAKGHGLAGLMDRLAAVDGTFIVESPPAGPTRLIADIPCALS